MGEAGGTEAEAPSETFKPCVLRGRFSVHHASLCRGKTANIISDARRIFECMQMASIHSDNTVRAGDGIAALSAEDNLFLPEAELFFLFYSLPGGSLRAR